MTAPRINPGVIQKAAAGTEITENVASDSNASSDTFKQTEFFDASDGYAASKQLYLSVYSYNAAQTINFKGFIMSYSDSYNSDWAEEKMFGRNDPVYTFKSTARTISIAFQVVASTLWEAMDNLENIGYLTKYTYPAYTTPYEIGTTMTSPPLVQIKLGNLIADHWQHNHMINEGNTADARSGGLLGVIRGLTITPQFDAGVFDEFKATIYPKLIEVSFDFGVLHQHKVGYDANNRGTWLGPQQFPYGVGGTQTSETAKTITRGWATGEATAGAGNGDPAAMGSTAESLADEQTIVTDADNASAIDAQGESLGQAAAQEAAVGPLSRKAYAVGNVAQYFTENPEAKTVHMGYSTDYGGHHYMSAIGVESDTAFNYRREEFEDVGGGRMVYRGIPSDK